MAEEWELFRSNLQVVPNGKHLPVSFVFYYYCPDKLELENKCLGILLRTETMRWVEQHQHFYSKGTLNGKL